MFFDGLPGALIGITVLILIQKGFNNKNAEIAALDERINALEQLVEKLLKRR